ncbi:serpin B3-like [Planococcus citri]|uniref:serpin B3-like n=1 Tax=Planococcus citri TaxID=170843 RepID=UPI0031F9727D
MRSFLWITALALVLSIHLSASTKDRLLLTEIPIYIYYGLLDMSVKIYHILSENNPDDRNIVFSPYGLYTFMALLHLSSEGNMTTTLHRMLQMPHLETRHKTTDVYQQLHNYLVDLRNHMNYNVSFQNGTVKNVKTSDFRLINEIYVPYFMERKESFLKSAHQYFNSSGQSELYFRQGIDARNENRTIERFNEHMVYKIHQLFDWQDPHGKLFHPLVFSSGAYFKMAWQQKFNKSLTKKEKFKRPLLWRQSYFGHHDVFDYAVYDYKYMTVDMMHGVVRGQYAELEVSRSIGPIASVFGLKSIDEQFTMFIVLPYENTSLADFGHNENPMAMEKLLDEREMEYEECEVDVKLPKFYFKWSKSIVEDLDKLGFSKYFMTSRQTTGMLKYSNIEIKDIYHTAEIKIDEDGIGDNIGVDIPYSTDKSQSGNSTLPKKQFHVNRSFFFYVYSHAIKSMMLIGTVFDVGDHVCSSDYKKNRTNYCTFS